MPNPALTKAEAAYDAMLAEVLRNANLGVASRSGRHG